MGYTILLVWTNSPPPSIELSDLILARLLEHHGLTHPTRSTIQFRTYRSTFPSSSPSLPPSSRTLTTIIHSQPLHPNREPSSTAKDDTAYLFLEDRPSPKPGTNDIPIPTATPLDDDGFEIIDPTAPPPLPHVSEKAKGTSFRTLAVRPASNVLPLLHAVQSSFVLGIPKSARAAASTTSQPPAPTPLSGQPLLLTSLTFPPLAHPNPALALGIHILPNSNASTIFLEAEYVDSTDRDFATEVLKEFLESCVPEGVSGERIFLEWESPLDDRGGWGGLERTRRSTALLARCLREGGYI